MSEQTSKIDELDRKIAETDDLLTNGFAFLLREGYSPGAIAGGAVRSTIRLMHVQGMSEMQITNELYRLIDGMREQVFKKLN
jgi:hypothetical protein